MNFQYDSVRKCRIKFSSVALLISSMVFLFFNFIVFQSGVASPLLRTLQNSLDQYSDIDVEKPNEARRITVAYAVTITKFSSGPLNPKATLIDRAAVLHQSIKIAMRRSHRYDYHMYAFIHPEAVEVKPFMERLGYRVQIRDTPFNVTQVKNEALIKAQKNSCCGEKEYLKLYSFLLLDYPIVVHVDMDYLFLKPMDDLFDLMTNPSYSKADFQHSAMWTNMTAYNGSIDFLYTRDYNMVNPPKRQPHQIGVQGGFFVVRPSKQDFEKFISVILSGGDFLPNAGWGGDKLRFGGYYGAGTIQGLASYYYGHLEPNRDIELNRCYYNTMVDEPVHHNHAKNFSMCRTLEPDLKCQDCRETTLEEIYSAHFTVCGKPERCNFNRIRLCRELLVEWNKVRTSLEMDWAKRYPEYDSGISLLPDEMDPQEGTFQMSGGHCVQEDGNWKYSPLVLPKVDSKLEMLI